MVTAEKKATKSMLALAEAMQSDLVTLSKAIHDELKDELKSLIPDLVSKAVEAKINELFTRIDKSIDLRTKGIGDQLEQRTRSIGEEVARAVKAIQPPQIVIPENAIKVIMEKSIVNFSPNIQVPKSQPVINVEQPSLNPVIRFEAPPKMITKKHIEYDGSNRPSLITETIVEDPDQE